MSLSPRRIAATAASLAGFLALAVAVPSANAAAVRTGASTGGVCANQTFGQPFIGLGDLNWYTLAPGGDFEGRSGWTFYRGASVKDGNAPVVMPGAGTGHSLSIPENGAALSPAMCVTTDYPSLRMFVKGIRSTGFSGFTSTFTNGLHVSIVYPTPGVGWGWKALYSASVKATGGWMPSQSMPTHAEWVKNPSLRLYFYADGGNYLVDNVFVDPKFRG